MQCLIYITMMVKQGNPLIPKGFIPIQELGRGAETVVWAVREEASGRDLAIKMALGKDPLKRLEREFALLKRFDHSGIVRVHEFGRKEGHPYFTMDWIKGLPFDLFLGAHRKEPDFLNLFLSVMAKALAVLSAIHREGVVHADVKPANLLLKGDGEPVFLDFGFAEDYLVAPTKEARGSLDYVAPELLLGHGISPAADLYSLGAMAYEVLAGEGLWKELSPRGLLAAKAKTPPSLRKKVPDIPSQIETIVLRLLEPEPALRPSAVELAGAILELMEEHERVELQPPDFAPALVFGGREDELAKLERLLFKEKRVVLLKGPQGIGKTRLMRELRFRALVKRRNVLLVEGRGGHLSLIDRLGEVLGAASGPETGAEHRYERTLQAIYRAGLDALLLDAEDDLSTYEEEGISFLARGLEAKCGLILTEVADHICPKAQKMELSALGERDVGELVTRTFESLAKADELTYTLWTAAEGIPGKMMELVEILYKEKWLMLDQRWVYEPPKKELLTDKLATWINEITKALSEDARLLLAGLSLARGPLPLDVLLTVSGTTTPWILKGLLDKHFVVALSYRGLPHYSLENDLLRRHVLDSMSHKAKRGLSLRLAKALERRNRELWGGEVSLWDDSHLVQLARLYLQADARGKATSYLLGGAKRLVNLYFYEQARELLEGILKQGATATEKKDALIELGRIADIEKDAQAAQGFYSRALPLVDDDKEEQARILLLVGLAYQRVGDLELAEGFFKQSEECLGDFVSILNTQLLTSRAWSALKGGDLDAAESYFHKGMKSAPQDSIERRRALYGMAWTIFLEGKFEDALVYAEHAFSENEATDKATASQAALLAADILQNLGRLSEAEGYIDKAIRLGGEMEYPIQTAEALRRKAGLLELRGNYRQARSSARQALDILGRVNDEPSILVNLLFSANQSKNLGEWEEAHLTYLDIWRRFHRNKATRTTLPTVLLNWAHLLHSQGRLYPAMRMLERAKHLAEREENRTFLLWATITECRISLGDYAEANRLLKVCSSYLKEITDIPARFASDLLRVELMLMGKETDQALEAAKGLLSQIEDRGFTSIKGEALRLAGKVYIASGEFETGLAKLRESAELLKQQENPYEHARSLYAIAEAVFKKQGYCDEALATLEEATVIFERLQTSTELERIERFRAEHFSDWREPGALPAKYLGGLKEISELINYRLGEEDFMIDLLTVALALTAAERGIVFLIDEAQLYAVASKRIDAATQRDARRISKTVIQRMQYGLEPVYTADAVKDERFSRSQSILLNNIRSLLCIPLKTADRLIGTIYLDSQNPGLFDLDKTLYFEALGNLLAATIDKSAEFTRLKEELRMAREKPRWEEEGIVLGKASSMLEIYSQLEHLAQSDANVLLEGETGTGKGVLAKMVHEKSPRRAREFCSINCGILPEQLFESELFGHRKGAYTGATEDRIGLLEAAGGATVFFDEITNTSPSMQAKLLEVIDERVIRRLGESRKRRVDLRFIFATNRELEREVREGRFREDLYFRIATIKVPVPALRERREDIPEFVQFFLKRFSRELNKRVSEVSDDVLDALLNYPWPGNIRELANVIERAVLLARGKRITPEFLDQRFFPILPSGTRTLKEKRRIEEVELISRTLLETAGNVTRAAKRLGISRQHLSRLIKLYGISRLPR